MDNNLKTIRKNLNLTQSELADILNIPVKSIRNWEQNQRTPSGYIIDLIINSLTTVTNENKFIDQKEDVVVSFLFIKEKVKEIVRNYNIDKVYLYGSYVKGEALVDSDIDLYMISDIDGIDYFGLIEDLRNNLNKKVDLLSNKTIKKDSEIELEIKRTGVLIYER